MEPSDQLWWKHGVIYHIYLRSFADSDGDGLGDFPGLIARLDHLNGRDDSLGIDAIWISPFYPSPDKDFGYDVADYIAVDRRYGNLADFDRLVGEAHRRGIRVMIDLVLNHTSSYHPWFVESRASRSSPRRDWYIWRDARPGQRFPNNWQSVFGGRAWEWDGTTRQFYYHMFLREQPDLNWRNPGARAAIMDVIRFWLDRGVDGFRLDVFSAWFKHAEFPDNPPRLGLRGFERQDHIYDTNRPEMVGALAELRALLDSYPERGAVGELFGRGASLAGSYCGPQKLHLVFNFAFTDCRWDPAAFQREILAWEAALGPDGWPCYVLSNHDIPRHISRYGGRHPEAVAKVAAAMLLTLRGTPFLYYGEEIGLPNTRLRRNEIVDPPGRRYWPIYKGRDPARCPMPWDATINAGFTTGHPWLPVHPAFHNLNVAAQREDPRSVFSFYRSLLHLRRSAPALHGGGLRSLQRDPQRGLVYLRKAGDQSALIALNFTPRPQRIPLDEDSGAGDWRLALSSLDRPAADLRVREVSLGPHEAAIFLADA
jgi:alpha-glucosidase